MNDDKSLEPRSGYCACPQLQELFKARKEALGIQQQCDSLKAEADLEDPNPSDLRYLIGYKDAVKKFRDSVSCYYALLDTSAKQKQISFRAHEGKGLEREISFLEAKQLLKKKKIPVTIHCSRCRQQIDIA